MGRKVRTKIVKKKSVKKNLRKNLMKRSTQSTNQSTVPSGTAVRDSLMNGSPTTASQANTLRNQLMQRAGLFPMYGYGAQQYGDFNNVKRINDLISNNQTIQNMKNTYDTTISSLTKKNEELKSQLKESRKGVKEAKHENDMLNDRIDEVDENIQEEERIKEQNERLKAKLDGSNLSKEVLKMKNQSLIYADGIQRVNTEIQLQKRNHLALLNKYNENTQYQEYMQKVGELASVKNDIESLQQIINSDAFQHANDALIETTKDLEISKYKNELYQNQLKLKKEVAHAEFIKNTTPDPKELEAIAVQYVEGAKKMNHDINVLNAKIEASKEVIEDLEYARKQYTDTKHKAADKSVEADMWENYKDTLYSHMSNDDIQSNLKAGAKEWGEQEARTYKAKTEAEEAEYTFKSKFNEMKNKAYNNEMNKDLDENIKKEAENIGKFDAENETQSELNQSIKTKRKAAFDNARARSRNNFMNSPEIQDIQQQIISNESQAAANQKDTEERDILSKAQKHLEETNISNQISMNTTDKGASEVDQVNFILTNQLQPRMNEINEKEEIYKNIMSESRSHSDEWAQFLEEYPKINELLGNGNWRNQSIQELNDILIAFRKFMSNPPSSKLISPLQQIPQIPPQVIESIDVNGTGNGGGDIFVEEEEENN